MGGVTRHQQWRKFLIVDIGIVALDFELINRCELTSEA